MIVIRLVDDFAGYRLWPETDLLVGFGTRLDVPIGRWGSCQPA